MRIEIRQSPPARVVALCFIFIVILGNIWVTYAIVGLEPPVWVQVAFPWVILATFLGGLWLAIWSAWQKKVKDEPGE